MMSRGWEYEGEPLRGRGLVGVSVAVVAIVLLALVVTGCGLGVKRGAASSSAGESVDAVAVNGISRWCLPVATTAAQQAAGLRGSVEPGMVFTFDPPRAQAFFMGGVKRPLTMVWVSGAAVVGVAHMKPLDTTPVEPPGPVSIAVELTPGMWPGGRTVGLAGTCQ
jgi:uncharacterized membrane protein (UPF0127 family)